MSKTPLRTVQLLMLPLALVAGSGIAPASEVPDSTATGQIVQVTPEQAGAFEDALQTLAQQTHKTFVAEGVPLHPTLDTTRARDLAGRAGLSQSLDRIAAAYDYDVHRQGNVFVLTKRYSDPADLPDVTPEECAQALRDMERVASPFNPQVPALRFGGPLVGQFAATLTREQLQAMRGKGLVASALSPAQQALVRRVALYFYVQEPTTQMETALGQLQISKTKVVFHWQTTPGRSVSAANGGSLRIPAMRVFGYDAPMPLGEATVFHWLSAPHPVTPEVSGVRPADLKDAYFPSDATDPTPDDAEAAGGRGDGQFSWTLGSLVGRLDGRLDGRPVMAVDAALQAKHVSVAGEQNGTPEEILDALALTYGLHIRTDLDGTRNLARPSVRIPLDVVSLSESMRPLLPVPLLRALHAEARDSVMASTGDTQSRPAAESAEQRQERWRREWQRQKARLAEMHQLSRLPALLLDRSTRRLRALIEPRLRRPDGQIALSALGPAGQQAFATMIMAVLLRQTINSGVFSQHIPTYIADFENTVITGGVENDAQGRPKFGMFLNAGTGIGNVDLSRR